MNKSAGQKIVLKFTEDLVGDIALPSYPSYKFYRWYITSSWSSYLYLYEIEMFYEGVQIQNSSIINIEASDHYSSYVADRVFDGSISSYWYTRGSYPQWIQIELDTPKAIDEFRWYTRTTSYKPKDFIFQGSNDGVVWNDLYEGTSPQTNYWIDFSFEPSVGEQRAFSVTGEEFKYVKGPLIDKEYKVEKVERHPSVNKALLLTMKDFNRFPTAEGSLRIEYAASIGSLAGRGGPVESFNETFIPTDLVPEPNPHVEETLTVAPAELEVDFIPISYHSGYSEEALTVAPAELELNLIYVGVINP